MGMNKKEADKRFVGGGGNNSTFDYHTPFRHEVSIERLEDFDDKGLDRKTDLTAKQADAWSRLQFLEQVFDLEVIGILNEVSKHNFISIQRQGRKEFIEIGKPHAQEMGGSGGISGMLGGLMR